MSIKKNRELMIEQIKRLRSELKESVNEAVSSSKIKVSLDKQIDWANIADDEIKLYPKPIRIEPDKFDSQLKKYSKAFKNPLIYLYGTTANKYNTTALFAVVSRLKSTTKIIFMSDKYAKAYGKGSLKDSDIKGVLKMNSLIASNAELNESVNESTMDDAIEKLKPYKKQLEKIGKTHNTPVYKTLINRVKQIIDRGGEEKYKRDSIDDIVQSAKLIIKVNQ